MSFVKSWEDLMAVFTSKCKALSAEEASRDALVQMDFVVNEMRRDYGTNGNNGSNGKIPDFPFDPLFPFVP